MSEVDSAEVSTPENGETNEQIEQPRAFSENRGIMRSASILAIGNIVSRILGLGRDTVMAHYFSVELGSAYEAAVLIPNNLFDAVKTGLVDSALVPVFSEIASEENRERLWATVSTFLSVLIVLLVIVVLLVEFFYLPIGRATGIDFADPELTQEAFGMMRLAIPAVLTLSVGSVLTATLYALKRFTVPAFLPAIFNGAIISAAWINHSTIRSLVYGILAGSILQIIAQLFVLRGAKLRWNFDWRNPTIKRIFKLFMPIAGVLVVDMAVRTISYNLAISTGDASLNYMRRATTLIQFPMGLVVTALSIAILPVLSEQAVKNKEQFKETLAGGIRLVLVLIIPAAVGLYALALPIVDLLFGHGEWVLSDGVIDLTNVNQTAKVLQVYLFGLPFAAVDQMLIFGSYARKNTLSPSIVGVISMVINIGTAFALIGVLGLFSLMVADAVKHVVHTLMMLFLLRRQIGGLVGYGILPTALKAVIAAGLTGLAAYAVAFYLRNNLWVGDSAEVITVAASGLTGVIVYITVVYLLKIDEVKMLLRRGRK